MAAQIYTASTGQRFSATTSATLMAARKRFAASSTQDVSVTRSDSKAVSGQSLAGSGALVFEGEVLELPRTPVRFEIN